MILLTLYMDGAPRWLNASHIRSVHIDTIGASCITFPDGATLVVKETVAEVIDAIRLASGR